LKYTFICLVELLVTILCILTQWWRHLAVGWHAVQRENEGERSPIAVWLTNARLAEVKGGVIILTGNYRTAVSMHYFKPVMARNSL